MPTGVIFKWSAARRLRRRPSRKICDVVVGRLSEFLIDDADRSEQLLALRARHLNAKNTPDHLLFTQTHSLAHTRAHTHAMDNIRKDKPRGKPLENHIGVIRL